MIEALEIATIAEALGPKARRLLLSIAQRLALGAKEHGDFEKPRELTREALEEHLDAVVYLALELQGHGADEIQVGSRWCYRECNKTIVVTEVGRYEIDYRLEQSAQSASRGRADFLETFERCP